MPARILSAVRVLGALAFAVALMTHVLSFFPVDPTLLLATGFLLFLPMVIVFGSGILAVRSIGAVKIPERGRGLIGAFVVLLLFGYAGISFVLTVDPRGVPVAAEGQFYLNNHGSLTAIGTDEYRDAQRRGARIQTSYEMLFLAVGTALLSLARSRRASDGVADAPAQRRTTVELTPRVIPIAAALGIVWQLVFAVLAAFVFPRPPDPYGSIWLLLVGGIVVFNVVRAVRLLRRWAEPRSHSAR